MNTALLIFATITLAGAAAAMTLRNLIHCALAGAVAFLGLAGLFLGLGAEFVAFGQVLVYVGAVAILIVIAVLLTRPARVAGESPRVEPWLPGVGIGVLVTGALVAMVKASLVARSPEAVSSPAAPVKAIGERLMTTYVLPLEVLGLLLTAALIGAVLLALRDPGEARRP
ncbi:MAG: NADH-quinone oxidoreductase subunit J [Verrucomicrobia bacterium]|jgi:NADH-quinone oxidoreductase subunit J|nr:NADH-quinone oxidoreductase subunit J [Verrucomicrobiota bacterium]